MEILFHEDDRDYARRNAAICLEDLGRTMSWELRKIRKSGEMLWVRETGRAMSIKNRPVVLVACEDITEGKRASEALREAQTQLMHANRVATMGQLTASIAHEVNQPIFATVSNAQAALHWLDAEPPNMEEVRASARLHCEGRPPRGRRCRPGSQSQQESDVSQRARGDQCRDPRGHRDHP